MMDRREIVAFQTAEARLLHAQRDALGRETDRLDIENLDLRAECARLTAEVARLTAECARLETALNAQLYPNDTPEAKAEREQTARYQECARRFEIDRVAGGHGEDWDGVD